MTEAYYSQGDIEIFELLNIEHCIHMYYLRYRSKIQHDVLHMRQGHEHAENR